MLSATRTLTRCLVCGSSEVRTDEVVDRGLVLLAQCPRCQHLWTVRSATASGGPGRSVASEADRAADAA